MRHLEKGGVERWPPDRVPTDGMEKRENAPKRLTATFPS